MVQFAKQINDSNYQAYVPQDHTGEIMAQGISRASSIEQQGMQLFSNIARTGMELYEGYNKKGEIDKVTEEMNNLNEEYMGRRNSPMLSTHQKTLDKMTNAYQQGVMSPQEYNIRVRALTREAINRAPGYTPELVTQANRVFEYSGMKDLLELDTQAMVNEQKARENYSKDVKELAVRAGLGYDAAEMDNPNYLAALNEQATKIISRESEYKAVESMVKNQENLTKADANSLFVVGADGKTSASKLFTGSSLATNRLMEGIFSQVTDQASFASAKQLAIDTIMEQENEFVAFLAPHIADPRIKALTDRMKEVNKTRLDAMKGFASKEDALAYAKNSQELFKAGAYMERYELGDINPYTEEALIRLSQTANLKSIIKEGKFNDFQSAITGLIDKSIKSFTNPKVTKDILKGAVNNLGISPALSDVVNSFPKTITGNADKLSPSQMYIAQQDYVTALAKGDAEKVKLMTPAGKADAINLINNYAKITWDSMVKDMTAASAEGKNVKFDTLPDGRLIVTGDISGEQSAKYTRRINDALQAMSNVYDISIKDAAEKYFYPFLAPKANDNPKLNKAEKEMAKSVQLSPEETQADISNEISDASITELKTAVSNASGEAKVTLQAELDRVLNLKEELKYKPSEKSTAKELLTAAEKFLNGDMFTDAPENFIADFINELRRRRAVKDTQADLNSYSQSASGKVKYKDKK